MEFISEMAWKEHFTDTAFIYALIIGSIIAILFAFIKKKQTK